MALTANKRKCNFKSAQCSKHLYATHSAFLMTHSSNIREMYEQSVNNPYFFKTGVSDTNPRNNFLVHSKCSCDMADTALQMHAEGPPCPDLSHQFLTSYVAVTLLLVLTLSSSSQNLGILSTAVGFAVKPTEAWG